MLDKQKPARAAMRAGSVVFALFLLLSAALKARHPEVAATSLEWSGISHDIRVLLVDALEAVKDQSFVGCATASTSTYDPTAGVAVPADWTISVVDVQGGDGVAPWVSCGAADHPLELVTIHVVHDDGTNYEASVVKRQP